MSEIITGGYGSDGAQPSPSPTPGPSPLPPLGSAPIGLSTPELIGWFLLMFPLPWVQADVDDPPGVLTGGSATAALFTAIANTMAVPGDWALPNANPQSSYTITFVDQHGVTVSETFPTGSKLQQQLRLGSAQGNALDFALLDFFGQTLPRNPMESDAAYLARAQLSLFNTPRITEPNVRSFLTRYTGLNPHFINPNIPGDVGGYSAATGSIITVNGKSVYASLVEGPLGSNTTAPPAYYGTDTGGAPFRYANPNGNQQVVDGKLTGKLQGGINPGFGFQVFIDTTYPAGWGAQGNAAGGYMVTLPVSNPPKVNSPTIGSSGGKSVFTNVAGSTAYVSCSSISTVDGESVFTSVTGGPTVATETVIAYFFPLGLTPNGLANGRSQLLTALNKLRAASYSFWVQTLSAVALAQKEWVT